MPNTVPSYKDTIVVHCLATKPNWSSRMSIERILEHVTRWHVDERGWKAVAYAEIIDRKGNYINGRDLDKDGDVWEETGAGARGWNKNAIHLALDGGFGSDANDSPYEHFTDSQLETLRSRINEIQRVAGRELRVIGHNEVAAKACPGFQVGPWYYDRKPRGIVKSKTMQGGAVAAVGTAGSAATAISSLDGNAQIMALFLVAVAVLGLAIVFRSRIKDWANGRR